MRREGPLVGMQGNDLVERHACTMPGPGLDPDEVGPVAQVCRLKSGGIFERVTRHDAVVGIGCRREDGRIILAITDIVIGRIGAENGETLLLVRAAKIGNPQGAERCAAKLDDPVICT